jgi:tight adherence protein B
MMIVTLAAICTFFVFLAIYYALAPEEWALKKRLKRYAARNVESKEQKSRTQKQSATVVTQSESNTSDILFKSFGADPHTLRAKLLQAGLKITVFEFVFYQLLLAVVVPAVGILLFKANIFYAVIVGITLGMMLPKMWLKSKINKRINKFNSLFPDAIETMLSTIKSGLPLINALQNVAENSLDPIKSEFKKICSEVSLGVQLADAVGKATERVPSQEMNFFAITLSIQLETGGSLTETFNNLAKILRNRQDLQRMIASKSAEAKMQSKVLAGLVILMLGGLYAASPDYAAFFLNTKIGNQVGIGVFVWMGIGFYIMNKITKIEY